MLRQPCCLAAVPLPFHYQERTRRQLLPVFTLKMLLGPLLCRYLLRISDIIKFIRPNPRSLP